MIVDNKVVTLDHMTHLKNLDTIFKFGLLNHNNKYKQVDISNQEVNIRRSKIEPIYGKALHEYVPLYFNPRNAMMYRYKNENIVILAFDLKILHDDNVIFTDKNASASNVNFYKNIKDIDNLSGYTAFNSWYNHPFEYEIKQHMMAEVLIYKKLDISYLRYIYVKNEEFQKIVMNRYNLPKKYIQIKPELFFKEKSLCIVL